MGRTPLLQPSVIKYRKPAQTQGAEIPESRTCRAKDWITLVGNERPLNAEL